MFTWNQAYTSFTGMCLAIITSAQLTWPTSVIDLYRTEVTPLTRTMEPFEVSLLMSLSTLGAMIGMPLYAYLYDHIGRKRTTIASGVPILIAWIAVSLTSRVEVVLTALLFFGIPFGGFLVCMAYCVEVADINLRGTLGSAPVIGYSIGTMVAYGGGYLEYRTAIYLHTSLVIGFLLVAQFTKESPIYFLQQNNEKAALEVLSAYRGLPKYSKVLLEEFYEMKRQVTPDNFIQEVNSKAEAAELEKLKSEEIRTSSHTYSWEILKHSRPAQRALVLAVFLAFASNAMGLVSVMVYAGPLFKEAVPSMDAIACSLMLSGSMLLACIVSSAISDRVGRKPLMIWSSMGSGFCAAFMGSQLQFDWAPKWLCVADVMVYSFVFNIGAGVVPFLIIGEIFAPEVRALCSAISMEAAFLSLFVVLYVFDPLVYLLDLYGVFYLFAGICFATVLFTHIYMPETMGRTHREIQEIFSKQR